MGRAERLITENLGLWSAAVKTKSSAGRGSNKKLELYGISKLRELILDLAVRGMLVQQDQNDEPASKYLERIAAAKIKLLEDKKIKKQRPLAKIETGSMEFHLPRGWQWERLGNLVEMYNGRAFKSTEWRTEGLPIVRIQNLNDNKADFNYFQGELSDSNRIANGSFLISWSGTPGTSFGAFIWERGPAALNQHINKCEFHSDEVNLDFMRLAVNGQMNHFISKAQGGVGLKHVTKGTLNNAILGIPPLAEQHRIVAKVDELMALCDQLEEEQENNLETHETLVGTLLNSLTSAADDSQFADTWQRIQDKFDILFTTESSVDQLKQTILQLAVMGKLLLQDKNDSPAEKLLEKISIEKAHLVKIGKIKKQKKPSLLAPEDEPFRLPSGWAWCSLLELCTLENGDRSKNYPNKSMLVETGIPFVNAGDLENGYISEKANSFITEERYEILNSGKFQNGDILFCLRGSLGKSAIVSGFNKGAIASSLVIIRTFSAINEHFLQKYFESPLAAHMISLYDNGTAQPNLSATDLGKFCVPIPPYKEQFRIVSKIDELLSVCDQLKANLSTAQETQATLADSLVEQAIHSPT